MKKLISAVLLLCMLFTSLIACNKKEQSEETTENVKTKEPGYLDTLPSMDFDGQEFKILVSLQHESFYKQEEESGNTVDSACFARNLNIEGRYNVDLVYTAIDGNASGQAAFQSMITNSIQVDKQDAFSIVIGQNYYCLPLISQGAYHNLRESTVIDFDAEWSHEMINDAGTINNKLYGASGAFVISQLTHALALYYNKDIFVDYGFAEQYDLYQLVREGKWTYEIFYQMVTSFDNVNEEAEDAIYGFDTFSHAAIGLHVGFGEEDPVTMTEENEYTLDNYYNMHLEDIFSRLRELYNDHAGVASDADMERVTNNQPESRMTHLLFCMNYIHGLVENPSFQKSENYSLGVLPAPKYDEAQPEYYTRIMRNDLYYIPRNVDFEAAALMIEALNYETHRIVYPEYWGKVIELRSADTSEDQEMIQILSRTAYSSIANYFSYALVNIDHQLAYEAMANASSMSGWWGTNQKLASKKLEKLIELYE